MYRIDYTKEWVMRLCNPRVCGYPEAKPRDKCKQVGYSAKHTSGCSLSDLYHVAYAYNLRCVAT